MMTITILILNFTSRHGLINAIMWYKIMFLLALTQFYLFRYVYQLCMWYPPMMKNIHNMLFLVKKKNTYILIYMYHVWIYDRESNYWLKQSLTDLILYKTNQWCSQDFSLKKGVLMICLLKVGLTIVPHKFFSILMPRLF